MMAPADVMFIIESMFPGTTTELTGRVHDWDIAVTSDAKTESIPALRWRRMDRAAIVAWMRETFGALSP